MMNALSSLLFEGALMISLVLLLVLLLRPVLRRLAGAAAVYASWCAAPLILLASLLPHPSTTADFAGTAPSVATTPSLMQYAAPVRAFDAGDVTRRICISLWLAGAAAAVIVLGGQQRRFVRGLGRLRPSAHAGVYESPNGDAGPALLGLLRPKIVVPADFWRRYTREEQALILLHERTHLLRGDLWANALCSALQVLFWFNPLLHIAARYFRFDQELACDASVLRRQPAARRSYAEAILKTQLAASGAPVGCNWQSRHPLKGRIMSMSRTQPHRLSRFAGRTLLALFASFGCYSVWAAAGDGTSVPVKPAAVRHAATMPVTVIASAAPAPVHAAAKPSAAIPAAPAAPAAPVAPKPVATEDPGRLLLEATYSIDGGAEQVINMTNIGGDGAGLRLAAGKQADQCEDEWRVALGRVDTVQFEGSLRCKGQIVAAPRMVLQIGERATMEFKGAGEHPRFKLSVLVTRM
jgi:beta-lactamase regulating signal transducer with metallopeptidase domain